ncbi:polysaccharide deacetylase family protein [Hyunsoonleella sp. SJ7]|uniref:Polysaccharide deacetylase family protein n=1 Tax=Hyunsoonleella aquatilis TaxID=2762758 RepID=A0A923H8B6_9FLAO|nr:polysaccharide deacetylase family protein [Hyunsoonleella aquatilis]MBC3757204.1 polysaccharide deacetylase family protein [Hyunsoonleella aquatilis]
MLKFRTVNTIFILLLIGFLLGVAILEFSIWWIFPIVLVWLVITVLGSAKIGWNYHFESKNSNYQVTENRVAITFDDGPHPEFTPKVLKLLDSFNAKASFFCIGKHIEAHPEIVKNTISKGHTIGNHTYSHSNSFGFFSTEKVTSELEKTNAVAKTVIGYSLKLYRPAFGITNPNIKQALKTTGLQSIGWSKRSFDTTALNENQILSRITKNLKKGDVILLHDTSQKTLNVLERLLLFLQERNYVSVTVDTLFNIKAYE